MVLFSNAQALAMAIATVQTIRNQTIQNLDVFVRISNGFCQNGCHFFPDFKWLGFQISDLIPNPDHLQPNLFWTIWNPDLVGFQIPIVL